MKTIINKISTTGLVLILLVSAFPTQAKTNDSTKIDKKDEALKITAAQIDELLASLESESIEYNDDSITYEFYNGNDQSIYTISVKKMK